MSNEQFLVTDRKNAEQVRILREKVGGQMTGAYDYRQGAGFMPEDSMDEPSFSVRRDRAMRFLGEMILAAVNYGLTFSIESMDMPDSMYLIVNGWESNYTIMDEYYSPEVYLEQVAGQIAAELANAMNKHSNNGPIWFVQIVVSNGEFYNANTGTRIAHNAQEMGEFLKQFPNIRIDIVSSYD